jgi:hypothetical protein
LESFGIEAAGEAGQQRDIGVQAVLRGAEILCRAFRSYDMEVGRRLASVPPIIEDRQQLRQGHERNHARQCADIDDNVVVRQQLLGLGNGCFRILTGRTARTIGPHGDGQTGQHAGRDRPPEGGPDGMLV